MMFGQIAKRVVRWGRLAIVDADGKRHEFGGDGPRATIRLHDKALHRRLALNPFLHLGEAYVDGTLSIEQGSLYDFMDICAANSPHIFQSALGRAVSRVETLLRHLHQYNPIRRAQANVAHHYDLSDRLYDLFLDRDRQYCCAYFSHPHADLEQAQADKKRHLAAKLLLRPGLRVLDIGSGWGGLALSLAEAGGGRGRRHHPVRAPARGQPASARGGRASPTGSASSCATIASRPGSSTGSSRSACSSTSASVTTRSSSGSCATC